MRGHMNIKRIQFIALLTSVILTVLLLIATVFTFRHAEFHVVHTHYTLICYALLSLGILTIIISWITGHFVTITLVLSFLILNPLLMTLNSQQRIFMPFVGWYLLVWGILFYFYVQKRNDHVVTQLYIEKGEEEVNKLNKTIAKASSALEQYFSRYSNYFNLREVANKFSTTLSLKKISHLIVDQTIAILKKGDACLLYLSDVDENILSLTASKNLKRGERIRSKIGTLYDRWVLKTRQNLIITDTTKDFRFDIRQLPENEEIKSLIAAPLIHGRRTIGTIRINAMQADAFSMDDLRILNIMAVLAASAIGNALLYQQTEELAIRDSLTNLYVQRYFKERIKEEHKRALITNAPLSLLMCDLDHFKEYNDKYGHAAGDMVLTTVAGTLGVVLGDNAIVARYGGEEFAVLLPKMTKRTAQEIADEVRRGVEQAEVDLRGIKTHISVSIGVSSLPEDTLDVEELISKADRRLYDAKKKGRNRVC